jgi:hypothetical protein
VHPTANDIVRRQALVFSFVTIFVTAHYGTVQPVLLGFSEWALIDPRNPFVDLSDLGTALNVCRMRDQVDLTDFRVQASVWLAALPFVQAEREAGVPAAQALLREAMADPSTVQQLWRVRVDAACEEWLKRTQ